MILKQTPRNNLFPEGLASILPEQEYKLYPSRYICTAHWSITGRCNYRCKHCYMSAPDAKFGELDHHQIMSIVQQLIDCGVMEVSLTGGEPLVRRDFMEIVDALLAGEITITTIYFNGKLVSDSLLDALEARGIHPEFNMSFDGTEGWHDWLRAWSCISRRKAAHCPAWRCPAWISSRNFC